MPLSTTDLRWTFLQDAAEQTARALDLMGYPGTREMQKVGAKMLRDTGTDRHKLFWICVKYYNVLKRHIVPRRRRVIRSPELNAQPLTQEQCDALDRIERHSRAGQDLRPYMSTKITRLSYNDPLLYDWGIHHLHLGAFRTPFVERSGPVLFARVHGDVIYFLKVLPHGQGYDPWVEDELIEIIHRNWPDIIASHRQTSIVGLAEGRPSPTHRKAMRQAGCTIFTQTQDGTVYAMLGGGYMQSGDSQESVQRTNALFTRLTQLADECVADEAKIDGAIRRSGGDPAQKRLRVGILPRRGVEIFDEVSCAVVRSETNWRPFY